MDRFVSYAQNAEDVILNRVFREQAEGFYIDIGANDPVADSVTMLFYLRGWSGINVEPGTGMHQRLVAHRTRDINLNVALSDRGGELTFHEVKSNSGLSTVCTVLADSYRAQDLEVAERKVSVTTLARLCEEHVGDRSIDFLKIDVEAHESEVLAGGDWRRWRPRILIVESGAPERWETAIEHAGYHHALFDGINYYLVREEDRSWLPILSVPANAADGYDLYCYQRAIEDYRQFIEQARTLSPDFMTLLEELGPTGLRLVMRMKAVLRNNPRLTATAKRLLRGLRVA
jgi:FkbM family methyltransferase